MREADRLTPDLIFRDPYLLDFLRLKDTYSEKEIETAILRKLEQFLLALRDHLLRLRRRAATVALKLSVIRSLFDYLKIAGVVTNNPALTKLVPPPKPPEDLRGRALTLKEVNHLLASPNRWRTEGARDYALMLLMLRTSLRVSEACSLK